ncbi:MAG: formyltetrahydrofolate deformylase [Propionibacterium sp.]|nr:formyltetrahydrofolate deformylase [Propionibacterium sp.]
MQDLVMTLRCPDGPGIVHALTGAVVSLGGNITECQQFASADTGRFFTRIALTGPTRDDLMNVLYPVAERLDAEFDIYEQQRPTRVLLLASKTGHCINELLFQWRAGTLPIDVVGVMANHDVLRSLADFYGVPFTHRVVVPETKADFEDELRRVVEEKNVDLVVLARYMQVLSAELCDHLAGRVINIHHSFLPGFKGSNPYRQAHNRGVKLIGATAHFVTSDLDEGPIIEQNVVRVDHTMGVDKLVSKGRGQESETLAEAVRLFAEHRVLMDGNRTVIFR